RAGRDRSLRLGNCAPSPRPLSPAGRGVRGPRSTQGWAIMLHHRSQLLSSCFLVSDLVVTAGAWLGAYYLRFESGWVPLSKPPAAFLLCWRSLPLVLALALLAFRLAGLYEVHRLRRFREELVA